MQGQSSRELQGARTLHDRHPGLIRVVSYMLNISIATVRARRFKCDRCHHYCDERIELHQIGRAVSVAMKGQHPVRKCRVASAGNELTDPIRTLVATMTSSQCGSGPPSTSREFDADIRYGVSIPGAAVEFLGSKSNVRVRVKRLPIR